jgi:GR25 family glycosyltransferase involved in LPS biosynthesis
MNIPELNNISELNNILYINLLSRSDREKHVINELRKLGLDGTRFNAIKMKNGAIGCSMSHLKCIQMAKENNWDHVCIVEDDIEFLDPVLFKKQLYSFLQNHSSWDVLLLAGNNMLPYQSIDDTCIKVSNCQTTTGYIVKKHYYDILIDNYKKGIEKLMKNPDKPELYSIDRYWFLLQNKDNWYLIIPLSVIQKEDYSDIQEKNVNFRKYMLDYNKVVCSKKY